MSASDTVILKALLKADGDFVSGTKLAAVLGMSRVAIWARLEKLRDAGFEFEAVRQRGYRLLKAPPRLNEPLIRAYLEGEGRELDLVFLPEVDSTNSEAERKLAEGREAPFVVLAGAQAQGRGRLGRQWHSPPEGNLYASFAFRPKQPHAEMQNITLWLGLAVCRYLHHVLKVPAKVKWPNDLLLGGKKVAGMLTEARIDADHTRELVFGLGLNVLGDTQRWPKEVSAIATSLAEHTPEVPEVNQLAAGLIGLVFDAYKSFLKTPDKSDFPRAWKPFDALHDRPVSTTLHGKPLKGVARGIDTTGALCIETPENGTVRVQSGEVSIGSASVTF